MRSYIGQTFNGLIILEQETYQRRPGKGSREGAHLKCTACGRAFHARLENVVKNTVACSVCRDNGEPEVKYQPTIYELCLMEIARRDKWLVQTSPGPWFYSGYAGVFSGPLVQGYDDWTEPLVVHASHSLERYTGCTECGTSQCQYFKENYDVRDPVVAELPAEYVATATGRHAADGMHIEIHSPKDARNRYMVDLERLNEHKPCDRQCDAAGVTCQDLGGPFQCCHCAKTDPCVEQLRVARSLGVKLPK
jgi:predicted  nucleic acid-binding Zn-ribbon protein